MKYIINSNIEFDTIEYILTSLNIPNLSIKLSNPAGRILEELIKHKNSESPVTRAHLFAVIWKNHGLEPSNGNLNQQISLIRKSFISLGLNASAIITVPKRGLKINNQIIIKNIEDNCQNVTDSSKNTENMTYTFSDSVLLSFKKYIQYSIILITLISIVFSISAMYIYKKSNNVKLYCCKEINSCNMCILPDHPKLENNDHYVLYSEIT